MSIYFSNKGKLDLDVIRIMGVSVKMGDNPIGYFGTGLKFAISTLLRTGHSVKLTVGDKSYNFGTEKTNIRGKDFQRVLMGDERLPFTTELGKNWEVWQAYRELHSNTLDEDGDISNRESFNNTVIEVTGAAIEKVYNDRHNIFISERNPIGKTSTVEVYPGNTNCVFYRGVRAGVLPARSAFTYNILQPMDLSEDRALKSTWEVEYAVECAIPSIDSREIADVIVNGTDFWDQQLDFSYCGRPSMEFLAAAKEASADANMNQSARAVLERHNQTEAIFEEVGSLTDQQSEILTGAVKIANHMGADISCRDLTICTTLGPKVYGLYHRKTGRIYISASALDNGIDHTAATVFEEWVHKHHKAKDHSRQFQDIVLQRFVQVTKEAISA